MASSLAAYVGQIQTHISAGLRGQSAFTYSLEQIADEFIQKRAEVLRFMERQGSPSPLSASAQTIDGLVLSPRDWVRNNPAAQALLANLPLPASQSSWHHCRVPQVIDLENAIIYLGPAGRPEAWTVVHEMSALEDNGRRLRRQSPICFLDGNDLWVTLRDGRIPSLLKMSAVFADPREPFRMGLSKEEHVIVDYKERDQTDQWDGLPAFPVDGEIAEKARLRVINLFLGTHGERPVVPNNGVAQI